MCEGDTLIRIIHRWDSLKKPKWIRQQNVEVDVQKMNPISQYPSAFHKNESRDALAAARNVDNSYLVQMTGILRLIKGIIDC